MFSVALIGFVSLVSVFSFSVISCSLGTTFDQNSDDHSNDLNQEQSIDTTRGLRKQIEFSVEIETKVKGIKDEISDKSSLEAKEILKNFKDYVNESVKKPDMKITYSGNKEEVFMKFIY